MFGAEGSRVREVAVATSETANETEPLRRPPGEPALVLFDGERTEELHALDDAPSRLGRSQLLWVDTGELTEELARELTTVLGMDERAAPKMLVCGERGFHDGGDFVRVTVQTPRPGRRGEVEPVTCVVGEHWVLTAHERPAPVLDELAELTRGSGPTGTLSGPSFLATLLEWVLDAYSTAFEEIEKELEQMDERAMRGRGAPEAHIESLVAVRRRAGRLRRELVRHRPALLALTQPELEALGGDEEAERFRRLLDRYDSAMQVARDARASVVSSFEVVIARTGHRTNEIMKVLTLASVILLPGTLLAGLLGMNFEVPLFEHAFLFWVVVTFILVFAVAGVGVAKLRRWI
jgi:magnesium transporter